jgi:hypothetical protein
MFLRETDPGLGRSGRVTPRLETLEDRCCPSTVTFQSHLHLLTLTGNSSSSTMVVRDDGHGDVRVTLDGRTRSFSRVQNIVINSRGGDDTIDYSLTGKLTESEQLTLHLGAGSDQVDLNYSKGVAAKSLNVNIDDGGGNQSVTARFGRITGTDLRLSAHLGDGMNHFTALLNGGLAGKANVDLNVRGGGLVDGVYIQADGPIGAAARLSVETAVGGTLDTVHVGYAGKLAGALSINEQAGRGWDWMDSAVNVAPGSTGSLVDHMQGGSGTGLVSMSIRDRGSHLKRLDAVAHHGSGRNTVSVTGNVRVVR